MGRENRSWTKKLRFAQLFGKKIGKEQAIYTVRPRSLDPFYTFSNLKTVYPKGLDPFYIVTYYVKWANT